MRSLLHEKKFETEVDSQLKGDKKFRLLSAFLRRTTQAFPSPNGDNVMSQVERLVLANSITRRGKAMGRRSAQYSPKKEYSQRQHKTIALRSNQVRSVFLEFENPRYTQLTMEGIGIDDAVLEIKSLSSGPRKGFNFNQKKTMMPKKMRPQTSTIDSPEKKKRVFSAIQNESRFDNLDKQIHKIKGNVESYERKRFSIRFNTRQSC